MKWFALSLVILFPSLLFSITPEEEASEAPLSAGFLSAKWLKQGGLYAAAYKADKKSLSPSALSHLDQVVVWYAGYKSGFDFAGLTDRNSTSDPSSTTLLLSFKEYEVFEALPEIAVFIEKNKEVIQDDAPAPQVVLAWILSTHPDIKGILAAMRDVQMGILKNCEYREQKASRVSSFPKAIEDTPRIRELKAKREQWLGNKESSSGKINPPLPSSDPARTGP